MNYKDYEQYKDGNQFDLERVPQEIIEDVIKSKSSLTIFYNNLDICRETLGESPVVAKILYTLYDYDRTADKSNFKLPDLSEYENGQMARVLLQVMINATKGACEKWITTIMHNRLNSTKPKEEKHPWER